MKRVIKATEEELGKFSYSLNFTWLTGISAAAPTFAAVISNLNYIRLRQGKTPLGFLNPWLYKAGHKGFTDIVDGGSSGCGGLNGDSRRPVPDASWNATKGWDPVTGFGTPNFTKLVKLMP